MRVNGKEVSVTVQEEASESQSLRHTAEVLKDNLDRKIQTISNEMKTLLITQLGCELSNYNMYKTFANYFEVEGLTKLKTYYDARADEELLHHNWIAWYLNYSGVSFAYPRIEAIDVDIKDRIAPFKLTCAREIDTTMGIYKIVELAQKEKDWITFQWLMGNDPDHGKLVVEQNEEEHISRQILKMAEEDVDWQTKEDTILNYYNK